MVTDDATGQFKVKYRHLERIYTLLGAGGWPPIDSSEWIQFYPSYSQLHTGGTISILILYLVLTLEGQSYVIKGQYNFEVTKRSLAGSLAPLAVNYVTVTSCPEDFDAK